MDTGRRLRRNHIFLSGSHSRWLGRPISAQTIMCDAMSAVTTFASIVETATSGARAKGKEPELLVDLAAVLVIELLPGHVSSAGHVGDEIRIAPGIGVCFEAHVEVLGVVVTPIETRSVAEPLVL